MFSILIALSLACSSGDVESPEPIAVTPPAPTTEPDPAVAEAPTPDTTAEPVAVEDPVAVEEPVAAEEPATTAPAETTSTVATTTTPAAPATSTEPVAAAEPVAEPVAAAEEPVAAEEPAAPPATTQTYTVDTGSGSQLYVQVFKDPSTAGAGLSHDHVIVARGWTGTVRWHPTDPSQCLIDISLPVAKLDADPPKMRTAVGYDTELSDSQRETVKKNLLAADQLDGGSHPTITYRARSCSGTTGAVTVTGDLTIRGKTQPVTTTLQVSLDGGFSATGSFKANQSDFGFQPYTAMLGALKNKDQMKFTVRLKG